HIGAAALAALDKALLLQQRKGLAHGLAAHGKLPRHLVFPRQALAVLVLTLEDAPFQLLKKMDILCLFFHRNDLPSPGVPSTIKLYLHLLYLHFTGLSGRCQGKTPGTARGSRNFFVYLGEKKPGHRFSPCPGGRAGYVRCSKIFW